MAGCTSSPPHPSTTPAANPTGAATTIRLATVTTIQDGGLLTPLLAGFTAQTGLTVQVHVGEDVYVQARHGEADLVFSHFGHKDAQAFLADGLGLWPRTVLFNSIALIAPTSDPAHVVPLTDPLEAFNRIAAARAPFIVNAIPELVYLADILWNATGRPDKTGWYHHTGVQQDAAMQAATQQQAYTLWGVTPFLIWQQKNTAALRAVLYTEEMFHRIMVSIVVNPTRFPHTNQTGAHALQNYLLTPATQALIRNHRYPASTNLCSGPQAATTHPTCYPHQPAPARHQTPQAPQQAPATASVDTGGLVPTAADDCVM
jgi:tungstate transport system substrate-binding protein